MANCVYVMARKLHLHKFIIYLAVVGEHEKRHAMPAQKPQAVSDWLNPHSLGTISAFGSIATFSMKFNLLN